MVAGVVRDGPDRVLLAQRPAGKHLAGGWEFPGGKLEPGERPLEALCRELDEELGLAVLAAQPLIRIRHDYPGRRVLLDVWTVSEHRGEPEGRDGQALRWCPIEALSEAGILPADRPVIAALRLPERLEVAESAIYRLDEAGDSRPAEVPAASARRLRGVRCANREEAVAAAAAGADFLTLRTALADDELAALCDAVNVPIYARGLPLARARALGASGVDATRSGGGRLAGGAA